MKRFSLAMALVLGFVMPASAQLYKWVDANGKVQYSDKPPPSNIKTQKLREAPRAPAPPAASASKDGTAKEDAKDAAKSEPKSPAEREQAFRQRQAEAAKAQEKQAQEEGKARERAEYCKRAKSNLASLELGGRQARINEKGERTFLTEEQIAQETAKARQEIASGCSN